jgi:hypothetical protein
MKCEECLPRIEEYVDGELDGRILERMEAHLSTCEPCASELAEIEREQAAYANYRRDIEVTPAQWNIVRARIEQEKDARTRKPRTRVREWFTGAFNSRKHFRPAFIAALLLIFVGITIGVIYLNSHRRETDVTKKPTIPNETLPIGGTTAALPPGRSDENKGTIVEESNPPQSIPNRQRPLVAKGPAAQKKTAVVATLPRSHKPVIKETATDNGAQLMEAAVRRDQLSTGVLRNASGTNGDFDSEVARHAERAELLLRSFRNVRLPVSQRSLDVSYERANARKLLYQNIALRRDAKERGDQPTAEILNQLEPILLDIANLPEKARARDVRSIEQRMEKKEIVATLQVRTLVASN